MPQSQGQILLAKADKKYHSSPGWFSMGGNAKYEEAGDMYQQAANQFKIEKDFRSAGAAFAQEADCRQRGNEINDAANAWWNAAKAYKQGFPEEAVHALEQTISALTKAGRFRQAADREKEIAQIHLTESGNLHKACESFERAGEWYSQEDAAATANGCYKEAADLRAQLDNFHEAIALYERVATHSLTSQLTKYSVKEYWLRSSLCALAANDVVLAKRNMTKYAQQDITFPSTREAKFIDLLIEAIEQGDQEAFTNAVFEFDQVLKLDNWKTAILLKVKKTINDELSLS
ncbi:vesicular-fusion protein SEC17 [Auriculariales sp. MPI-PUGE-AT-0066]|nr:vesicular-fusion protein SEC17 [Auriculariales sp. MPI-PUGE-AT-0066]